MNLAERPAILLYLFYFRLRKLFSGEIPKPMFDNKHLHTEFKILSLELENLKNLELLLTVAEQLLI